MPIGPADADILVSLAATRSTAEYVRRLAWTAEALSGAMFTVHPPTSVADVELRLPAPIDIQVVAEPRSEPELRGGPVAKLARCRASRPRVHQVFNQPQLHFVSTARSRAQAGYTSASSRATC